MATFFSHAQLLIHLHGNPFTTTRPSAKSGIPSVAKLFKTLVDGKENETKNRTLVKIPVYFKSKQTVGCVIPFTRV